eukprot:m.84681 g.84681  ORF g.84681 m.84681 type:complete len:154 (-) comp25782_c1_seq1:178-639(-)
MTGTATAFMILFFLLLVVFVAFVVYMRGQMGEMRRNAAAEKQKSTVNVGRSVDSHNYVPNPTYPNPTPTSSLDNTTGSSTTDNGSSHAVNNNSYNDDPHTYINTNCTSLDTPTKRAPTVPVAPSPGYSVPIDQPRPGPPSRHVPTRPSRPVDF